MLSDLVFQEQFQAESFNLALDVKGDVHAQFLRKLDSQIKMTRTENGEIQKDQLEGMADS